MEVEGGFSAESVTIIFTLCLLVEDISVDLSHH